MGLKPVQIAAIVVVVIAVVAVCAFFVLKGDGDKDADYSTIDVSSSLAVYGNANGDALMNSYDIDIIQDIIDGKKSKSSYPLADANQDGKITDADIEIVKKLMKKEATEAWVICEDYDGNQTSVKVQYPLRNVVSMGTSINQILLNINAVEYTAGFFSLTYKNFEKALNDNSKFLGGSSGNAMAGWANFTQLASDLSDQGGIGAFISVTSIATKAVDESGRKDLTDANIPVLIFPATNAKQEVAAALAIGFLMGGTPEQVSKDYALLSWDIFDQIDQKVAKLSSKNTVISITMGKYVAVNTSDTYGTLTDAGGLPYWNVNSDFKKDFDKSKSVAITVGETLSNYDDANNLVSIRSSDTLTETSKNAYCVSIWDSWYTFFDQLDDYKGLFYVNNLLPGALKLAYIFECLYPNEVSSGWADAFFTDMAKSCVYLDGCTLENTMTCITYDDYKAAGGTH